MPLDSTGEVFTPGGEQLADKLFYHIPKGSVIKYQEPEWVEEAPEDWRVYGRINRSWIPLDVADVPPDDLLYARRNGVWVRVTAKEVAFNDSNVDDELMDRISRQGDSMLGNLALLSPPSADFHAVNKQYVDRVLAGVPVIIGVFDANSGECTFTPASGLDDGPLPPAVSEIQGVYLIVTVAGTVPEGPVAGITFNVGDWVFCDGVSWVRLAIGGVGSMGEAPLDGGYYSRRNADWEKIFEIVSATVWRFRHGLYIDAGPVDNTFLRVIGGSGYFQVEARGNGQMGYTFNAFTGNNRLHFQEQNAAVFDIYPGAFGCHFDKFISGVARRLMSINDPTSSINSYLDVWNPNPTANSILTVRHTQGGSSAIQLETRAIGDVILYFANLAGRNSSILFRAEGSINKFDFQHIGDNFYFHRYTGVGNQVENYLTFDPTGVSTAKDPTLPRHLATKTYVDSHSFIDAPIDTHYYARCDGAWERIFSRQNINTLLMPWSLMIQDTSRTTTIFDVRNGGSIVQYNVSAGAARLTFQAPTLGATMDILLQNTAHPTWYWVQECLSQISGSKRPGVNFLKRTSSDDVILHIDEDGYVEGRFVTNAGDPVNANDLVRKAYVDSLYGRMVITRFDPPTIPLNTQFTLHVYGVNFAPNSILTYINTPRTTTFHDSGHISAFFGSGAQAVPREVYIQAEGRPASNIVFFTPTAPPEVGEIEEERPIQKPVEEDLTYVGKLEARLALLEVKFKELEKRCYATR